MFEIEKQLLEEIVNYLASKPYIETFKIIGDLQRLKKIEKEVKNNKK